MAVLRLRARSLSQCFAETAKAFLEQAEDRQSRIRKRSSIAVEESSDGYHRVLPLQGKRVACRDKRGRQAERLPYNSPFFAIRGIVVTL
jgi:hypothetical protein